jgi:hypothetical protein
MGGRGTVAGEPVVVQQHGGWWVLVEIDNVMQQYRCATENQARRFAEMLARQKPRANPAPRALPTPARGLVLPRVQVLSKKA